MPPALVIGGTGQIGQAVARRMLPLGWQAELTGRDARRMPVDIATFCTAERDDAAQLRTALGAGADLLVDCICYTAADARLLVPLLGDVTAAVPISSKAGYEDAAARHTNSDVARDFGAPITEAQPTVAAGDGDYNSRAGYGANNVAAEQVLLDTGAPVTVLRPSKVHGRGATRPREWIFVKRVLDRRPAVLLAHLGAGVDHPSATANIAALAETVAARPGRRILNSADPGAPSALQIARIVARHLGHSWTEVLLDDAADAALGRHPWDAPHPIVLDMSAADALGYRPAGDYAQTAAAEIDWLTGAVAASGRIAGMDEAFFGDSSTTPPRTATWPVRCPATPRRAPRSPARRSIPP